MNARFSMRMLLAIWIVLLAILAVYPMARHTPSDQYVADNRDTINVAPYIYGKTPPVSLGEIKNPDNAYIHLKFRFRADSTEGYPNVFQTAPANRGMRMEITGSSAAIIIQDLSISDKLTNLTLSTELKTGQWYTLEVEAKNGAYVRATLDGRLVADYASAGLTIEASQLLVGGGFDALHAFRGKIEDISITKGNVPQPSPEPFTSDNRDTITVAPYIYGKTPPISLGEIKNPDNAYIHLKFRFRADSTDGYPNVFQTAPVNRGMRMEITGSSAALIVPDVSVPGGLKGLALTTALRAGQWHTLEVGALNGSFVHATLDGNLAADYESAGLSMETAELMVGGGFDASRVFRGQIKDISITKGTPPLRLLKNRGIQYAFFAVLLIGSLIWLVEFLFAKNKFVPNSVIPRRAVAYTGIAMLFIGLGFIYYVYFLIVNGYLPSPFVWSKSETFMDLFNTMYWVYNDGRYAEWGSIYPPLSFFILKFINFVFAGAVDGTAAVMRDNSPFVIVGFCLIYLAVPAILLRTKPWRGFSTTEKILIYFAFILSAPMLFALERGNIIVVCPILLAFVLSRIGFVRCLCISLLINIKPYFALLLIYYIARKNWKAFATCAALSGLIFAVLGFLLDGHFLLFFKNLLSFSRASEVFSIREVMALPSSISAFSYALLNPDGVRFASHFLSPAIITTIAYVIEATKWGVLAIAIKRPSVMRDAEIISLLVVAITNLGISVGGYSLILYIALIPIFMQMRAKWLYLGLLSVMAMPIDIIPLMSFSIGEQYSYLTNSYVNVQWTIGLGSVVRPVANLALLLLLSWEFFSRKDGATTAAVWVRKIQQLFSEAGFYIGLGAVLFAVLLYNSIYFNRYFSVTEGWFSAYAHLIRHGLVPYRDFYLFITPLYPLQLAAFQAVFGESFIALRIFGVGIVLLLSFFLYLILARRFSPLVSAIAAVTAIIYYQSGVAHIAYDFIQVFSVFVLAATYLIIRYSDEDSVVKLGTNQNGVALLFLAGILVSLAFLTKQSNGALVVVFSMVAVALATAGENFPYRLRNTSVYMLGMALPVLLMGLWLYFVGALTPFIDQVVFGAIEAKGSIWSILFSWIGRHVNRDYFTQLILALLYASPLFAASLIGTVLVKRRESVGENQTTNLWKIFLYLVLFAVAIVIAIAFSSYGSEIIKRWVVTPGIKLLQSIVAVSTALTFVLMVSAVIRALAGLSFRRRDLAISATMTLGLVFGNGTSAGIGEVSVFLSFALVLAFLMSLPNVYGIAKIVVGVVCLSLILFLINAKLRQPYAWWYVSEPDVRESTTHPALPLLAGFRLSSNSTQVLEEATRIIQAYSRPGEDVFTFPNIPGFYVLADRWPHSKVVVSWFDFLPDILAKAEANRLRASPPVIIVNLKLPEAAWAAHESLFREGKPLGQRDIQAAILELTEQLELYQLDFQREVSPGCVLEVWHKKEQ